VLRAMPWMVCSMKLLMLLLTVVVVNDPTVTDTPLDTNGSI
jgi:hypothetical protein